MHAPARGWAQGKPTCEDLPSEDPWWSPTSGQPWGVQLRASFRTVTDAQVLANNLAAAVKFFLDVAAVPCGYLVALDPPARQPPAALFACNRAQQGEAGAGGRGRSGRPGALGAQRWGA